MTRPTARTLPSLLATVASRGVLAVLVTVMVPAAACSSNETTPRAESTTTGPTVAVPREPAPPRLVDDFAWTGRYIVPDLDVEVPFTWTARDGDFQMTAGDDGQPIHFTNVVADGFLYTLTYTWPEIPRMPCSPVGEFSIDDLNKGLADAAYVGAEVLEDRQTREVFHYRSAAAIEVPTEALGLPDDAPVARIPVMAGDIYVDREDPGVIWKLLHFGVQNLYDANLDAWIVIDDASSTPGDVSLPQECVDARAAAVTDAP